MSHTEVSELLAWVNAQPTPTEPVQLCTGSTVVDMPKLIRVTEARILAFKDTGKNSQHPTYTGLLQRLQLIKAALC